MSDFKISLIDKKEITFSDFENQYVFSEKDLEFEYNPFAFSSIQFYNPIFSTLPKQNVLGHSQIMNQQYFFNAPDTVLNLENGEVLTKPMFIKYSPLLDVYSYLIGKFEKDSSLNILPSLDYSACFQKYNSPHSIPFVDSFFCYLSGRVLHERRFVNGIDFYGSFVGIQKMFRSIITEDIEYLNKSSVFISNVNNKFKIDHQYYKSYMFNGSNSNRPKLKMDSLSSRLSIGAEEMDDLNYLEVSAENYDGLIECDTFPENNNESSQLNDIICEDADLVYDQEEYKPDNSSDNNDCDNDSVNSSPAYCADSDSELNYSSDEGEEGDEGEDNDLRSTKSDDWTSCSDSDVSVLSSDTDDYEDEDNEEDESNIIAYIPNYPVQMICLEKCDSTLDSLFVKREVNEENGAAYLMQIIMTLLAYQIWFQFTHNDLHTNNIMYVETEKEYLVYRYEDRYYLVPTFGKIMKIIDFGRSIYRVNGVVYCSDSFSKEGDAFGQYNTEPFINNSKPRIDPNYSFDLCRLACSIYNFIIEHDESHNLDNLDELQKTIVRWCTDDNKKNVLYKTNGEERYPDFKLYKMIARNVHRHTPREQLSYPLFSKYEINSGELEVLISSGKIRREDIMHIQ